MNIQLGLIILMGLLFDGKFFVFVVESLPVQEKIAVLEMLFQTIRNQTTFLEEKVNLISSQVNDIKEILDTNHIKKKKITRHALAQNVSIEDMKSQGYQLVYDYPYSHFTAFEELNAIKSKCTSASFLCAGGAAVGSDKLLLVSCGKCQSILTPTQINQPVLDNGAYWYFTDKKSFGFSSSNNIKQKDGDIYDCDAPSNTATCKDEKRLSWHLNSSGGWRLDIISGIINKYEIENRLSILVFRLNKRSTLYFYYLTKKMPLVKWKKENLELKKDAAANWTHWLKKVRIE